MVDIRVDTTGLDRPIAIWTAAIRSNGEIAKHYYGAHLDMIKMVKGLAREEYANTPILRPQEQGLRASYNPKKGRMTGRFGFGENSAFRGEILPRTRSGFVSFGWPNERHADKVTRGIWRVLEFGLGDKRDAHASASRGKHLVPSRFWVDGSGQPVRQYDISRRGEDVLVPADRARGGKGIEGKRFLRKAWNKSLPELKRSYVASTEELFRRVLGA